MFKRVAIIGSRRASEAQFERCRKVAAFLVRRGIEIATGGADRIDEAAMIGAASVDPSKLHVFLPWKKYNQEKIPAGANTYLYHEDTCPTWNRSVDQYHPAPGNLGRGPRALHARNYGIIMYPEPVDFVIAVPQSLTNEGGTGQGMRIALANDVPLYNLLIQDEWLALKAILDGMKERK